MRTTMIWADIGMAVAIVGFVGIVGLFQDETFFAPLMIVYMAVVVVFAFICEWAETKAESAQYADANGSGRTMSGLPIPH